MLLPVLQVSLPAEDDSDAPAPEANTQLAAVARPMLLQPLLKLRIVFTDASQLKGTRPCSLV
jgi:hypothetical protein